MGRCANRLYGQKGTYMITIYDLLDCMDNMNFNIIVQNDAKIENEDEGIIFEGEVSDFKETDLFDEVQYETITDLYTLSDGRMYICYNDEW